MLADRGHWLEEGFPVEADLEGAFLAITAAPQRTPMTPGAPREHRSRAERRQPADPPAPSSRTGRLFRAEAHRFRSRRFLQVLLGLAVLGWIAAPVIAVTQFGDPTAAERADARAGIDVIVADNEMFREQCLDNPEEFTGGEVPEGVTPDENCGPAVKAADFRVTDFIEQAPFDFAGPWRPARAPSSSLRPWASRSSSVPRSRRRVVQPVDGRAAVLGTAANQGHGDQDLGAWSSLPPCTASSPKQAGADGQILRTAAAP